MRSTVRLVSFRAVALACAMLATVTCPAWSLSPLTDPMTTLPPLPMPPSRLPVAEAHAAGYASGAGGASGTPDVRWIHDRDALARLLHGERFQPDGGRTVLDVFRPQEHVAVVVRLGTRPTGGYAVALVHASGDGHTLRLRLREDRPSPSRFVTQALSAPVAVFVLPWRGEVTLEVSWTPPGEY